MPSDVATRPERRRPVRSLRRDAALNQERLLAAAVTTMLREGRSAPMATIAAEAGVGVGTLYRRYPSREALIEALELRAYELLAAAAASTAASAGTGLDRLGRFWDRLIDEYDVLVLPRSGGPILDGPARAAQTLLHARISAIVTDGHRDGSIRADVTFQDVLAFGAMLIAPLRPADEWRPVARRQKELHLDGLAARA